ncbi:hypothetical protein CCACVL1_18169 [Corchorus capsularis]|uniref:Uncharacterized protein n=1 Tax=Corchorus capsularis TaxID=210143 RepID=A0A1R3HML6_COCAP|nr:hypothetical protein CCACVL1_18169 [Corchorus capsularis]
MAIDGKGGENESDNSDVPDVEAYFNKPSVYFDNPMRKRKKKAACGSAALEASKARALKECKSRIPSFQVF